MVDIPEIHARKWLAVLFGVLAAVLAVAALIVALTRAGSTAAPTYAAVQRAEAKTTLCGQYKLAAQAIHIESSTPGNTPFARVAMSNGALMLETSARVMKDLSGD